MRLSIRWSTLDVGGVTACIAFCYKMCGTLFVLWPPLLLCAMLLIGAGLLIRSFARVRDLNPGFDPHNVLTLELTMTGER